MDAQTRLLLGGVWASWILHRFTGRQSQSLCRHKTNNRPITTTAQRPLPHCWFFRVHTAGPAPALRKIERQQNSRLLAGAARPGGVPLVVEVGDDRIRHWSPFPKAGASRQHKQVSGRSKNASFRADARVREWREDREATRATLSGLCVSKGSISVMA